jgi:hypothetical protein
MTHNLDFGAFARDRDLIVHQLGWRVATKTLETTKKKRMRPQKLLNLRFREEVFLLLINGFLTPDNRAHHQHIRRR